MKKPSFFQLACSEPYRFFFPLGLLAGMVGVALWPLYFAEVFEWHPGILHARLMVEGFMGAFIFGFLGTAGPRLTGTPTLSLRECTLLLALYFVTLGCHFGGCHRAGDLLFLILLGSFIAFIGKRFIAARGFPPPGFILVGFGFACAVAGAGGILLGQMGLGPAWAGPLSTSLLNEAWVLMLILGVGSFLFPRFLQIRPAPLAPGPVPGWKKQTTRAVATGTALVLLYALDAWLHVPRVTALARFGIATAYLVYQIGIHRSGTTNTVTRLVHASVVLALMGLAFPFIWPLQRVAGAHFVFIGGFALITLTVATRVIFGHSGLGMRAAGKLPFLATTALFFVAGLALRVGADFWLPWRNAAISLGAWLWIAGALVWAWSTIPRVRLGEGE